MFSRFNIDPVNCIILELRTQIGANCEQTPESVVRFLVINVLSWLRYPRGYTVLWLQKIKLRPQQCSKPGVKTFNILYVKVSYF